MHAYLLVEISANKPGLDSEIQLFLLLELVHPGIIRGNVD